VRGDSGSTPWRGSTSTRTCTSSASSTLKEHYAATTLLGEVTFHNLITDYLLRHPPTHFSIRGPAPCPGLLAEHDVGRASQALIWRAPAR
jgi:hypothetical protein